MVKKGKGSTNKSKCLSEPPLWHHRPLNFQLSRRKLDFYSVLLLRLCFRILLLGESCHLRTKANNWKIISLFFFSSYPKFNPSKSPDGATTNLSLLFSVLSLNFLILCQASQATTQDFYLWSYCILSTVHPLKIKSQQTFQTQWDIYHFSIRKQFIPSNFSSNKPNCLIMF